MHYASVENLTKSLGARVLFRDVTFHISEGDKIALIARNGYGKSTLLHLLAGKDQPDEGRIWIHKDIQLVLLKQEDEWEETLTVREQLFASPHPIVKLVRTYEEFVESGQQDPLRLQELLNQMEEQQAWHVEQKLQQILSRLRIHQMQQRIAHLSGGQRKRLALAQALLETELYEGHCLLMLDEPTNHLDVEMIEWLEQYLSTQKTTLLMVTHDRYFLDEVCNEIIEMDQERIYIHQGDYAHYLEQKAHRQDVNQSEWLKDKNIYRRELEWMRKQPRARTTKSRSRQDAFRDIEDRVKLQKQELDIQLQVKMTRLGGKVLEMKKVYKSFGDKVLLRGFDYTFKRGERIGIVGKNGVGKSTFLRIALQLMEPDSGKINHGETVVFGHFSQEGLQYKEDKRVIEFVKDHAEFFPLADGTKLSASKFLERFAFTSEQQYTYLSLLSGGEKRRLQLLSILFRNPNFLVLDEPTNDLDLQTLQLLEEFLLDYQGCILLVSHDRYFMDKLVDHLFVFEGDGHIRDFPGNYSQYRQAVQQEEKKNEQPLQSADKKTEEAQTSVSLIPAVKLSFKERRELESLETDIPALHKEKETLEASMSTGGLSYDDLQAASQRISAILHALEEKEFRWLELSERPQ